MSQGVIIGVLQRTVVPIVNPKISCLAGSIPDCSKTPFTANSMPVVTSGVVGFLKDAITPLVDGSPLRVISTITPSVLVPREINGRNPRQTLVGKNQTHSNTHLLHRLQSDTCCRKPSSIWIKRMVSMHEKAPVLPVRCRHAVTGYFRIVARVRLYQRLPINHDSREKHVNR